MVSEIRYGNTTVLLICREGNSREVYHGELSSPGVLLVCVQSLFGFFQSQVYCALNGILVDMPTYMRCSEDEKSMITELVAIFPSLRLKCNEQSGEIRTLPFGTNYRSNIAPALFVKEYCVPFSQRRIRSCQRSHKYLTGLLNADLHLDSGSGTPTVTTCISCSGAFVVTFEPWIVGRQGWLTLPDLEDASPVKIEICSIYNWGKSGSIPGMGVRFVELSASQKNELTRRGGQNFMIEDS